MESEQLGLKITTTQNYILVEPSKGIVIWEVMFGIAKLVAMPEFRDRNDIWVFRAGKMDIAYADLYKIKEYVIKNSPHCPAEKKTAIVVATGLQRSLAELYTKIAEDLQHEVRVFADVESAEKWITEK